MYRYTSEIETTRWSAYATAPNAPKTNTSGSHAGPFEATSFRRRDSHGNLLCRSSNLEASILELGDALGESFKEDFRHHPFVFVIEKMAVKDGHAFDHRVGEVHDDVDGTAGRNIHGVQPQRVGVRPVVFGVGQEMDLMDVHGV